MSNGKAKLHVLVLASVWSAANFAVPLALFGYLVVSWATIHHHPRTLSWKAFYLT